jgi:hypothetical protein
MQRNQQTFQKSMAGRVRDWTLTDLALAATSMRRSTKTAKCPQFTKQSHYRLQMEEVRARTLLHLK